MNFDPNQIAQKLTASIRLSLPPIAICFTDKVPAGIRTWTGRVPAGCRFWQEAATEVFANSSEREVLQTRSRGLEARGCGWLVGLIWWTDCLQNKEKEIVYGCSNRTSGE